jgi:ParB family transcriptional regulator, chromosome partitioning protein
MTKPKTIMIALGEIAVPADRMRQLRPRVVDDLAESIKTEGLLQPIIVRRKPRGKGFLLVAGWHRYEAKRKLGHDTIERCGRGRPGIQI